MTLHNVWLDFFSQFIVESSIDEYKYSGHQLMEMVELWAKKYPNDVEITSCDDACYSSSYLVLIDHKDERTFHGTTIVYIPQNSGSPSSLFLNKNDRNGLLKALIKMKK